MAEVEYESSGVPLEDYQLTRSDHRKQKQSEASSKRSEVRAKEARAREQADPEITRRKHEAFRRAWELMQKFKTPEHEIMRWRVRLYCGHIAETRRHREVATPTTHGPYSMQCPECGKDPSVIVAYEPIGLAAEPPPPPPKAVPPPPSPKKPTRAQLERRLAALEEENRRLRSQEAADDQDL
ncbi:hypothetical protein ACGF3G_43510 [Streptomyces sp. NPDC048179]|uniref:hypothetical protein n=1 Tax=Streptomyces sp. NPDC048179 TaxID=3365506 RepID=UPI0037163A04